MEAWWTLQASSTRSPQAFNERTSLTSPLFGTVCWEKSVFQPQIFNKWSLNNLGKGTKNSVYVVVSWSQAFSDLLYQAEYALTIAHSGGFCLQDKHPLIEYFRSISLPLTLSSDQEQNSTEIRIQALESDNIGLNFSSVIYWLCDLG